MTTPTGEQAHILNLFNDEADLVVEAGAGTGKTTTLQLMAEATSRHGRYLAFNKAVVSDVAGRLPDRVVASTAHSLAFRAVGKRFAHRFDARRMRSIDIARKLRIHPMALRVDGHPKTLAEGYLGGYVMRALTRFCQTADEVPATKHFPYVDGIDMPTVRGDRTYENNDRLASELLPALRRAWDDVQRTDGSLTYSHAHYLKVFHLEHHRIDADFILFDEAQDANPVLAAIVGEQDHAQRVWVGDGAQAIYAFTGAVNSIERLKRDGATTAQLSQSFRFGPEIAAVANDLLAQLGTDLRLKGLDSIPSTVGPFDGEPDAILCRTNAGAVDTILGAKNRGVAAHLVGGGGEVVSFAKAAQTLMDGQPTYHPELACFSTWGEVQEYVDSDAQGDELRLMVSLVDRYGVDVILEALERMPSEAQARLRVSTAHKAKGREWSVVRLANDFASVRDEDGSETRLRYVACTRARRHLDAEALDTDDEPEGAVLEAAS